MIPNFKPDVTGIFPPHLVQPRLTQTRQAECNSQQALEWNSVSSPKLNTLLCYCNSRQASGCSDSAPPTPPPLIHFDSRWRSLAWLGICDRCQRELWMGSQAGARAHAHTHTHVITSTSLGVRVTFKQRNSAPHPSSACPSHRAATLYCALKSAHPGLPMRAETQRANRSRSRRNKQPCQACITLWKKKKF